MKIRPGKALFELYFKIVAKGCTTKSIDMMDNTPQTFLVISNTALGDTILSTPAIKSLKKSFPNSKIVALIHKSYVPLFDSMKYIDVIIPFYGGYRNIFKTIDQIKKHTPDMAMIFHGNAPLDIQISVLSGCKYVLKTPTKTDLKQWLSYDFINKDQHTIEDRLDLVRLIGGENIDKYMEVNLLKDKELQKKFEPYKDYIGFQIGAANRYKEWPIENFIALAKKLSHEKILITGIQKEWEMADKIVKACPNVLNLCGACSIEELPYLIKNLKMLITNDTGTMHLAIALKKPTISLFSATASKGIGPYQDLNIHKVIQKEGSFILQLPKKKRDNSAMKMISTEEVLNAYEELL